VRVNVPLQGRRAGENLAPLFERGKAGVWRLVLDRPIQRLAHATITVRIRDCAGNWTRLDRDFSVSSSVTMSP
jgi:hypothetical protein